MNYDAMTHPLAADWCLRSDGTTGSRLQVSGGAGRTIARGRASRSQGRVPAARTAA